MRESSITPKTQANQTCSATKTFGHWPPAQQKAQLSKTKEIPHPFLNGGGFSLPRETLRSFTNQIQKEVIGLSF